MYVDKQVEAAQVVFATEFDEYMVVKIRGGKGEILVCTIYRSPNSNLENDKNLLEFLTNVNMEYSCNKVFV